MDHVVQFDNKRETLPGLDMHCVNDESRLAVAIQRFAQVLHGRRQLVP